MMSILQDLDPQYAKIQRQSSIGSWKLIAGVVSLLLVLTWVAWLIFTLRTGNSLSSQGLLKKAEPEQVITEITSQKASTPLSTGSPQAAANPSLPSNTSGNAIIQETRLTTSSVSNTTQPESINQAKVDLPANHPSDTKSVQKRNEPTEKKSAGSTVERKQNNSHSNKETSAPVVVTKKAAERDIDIITAIVR